MTINPQVFTYGQTKITVYKNTFDKDRNWCYALRTKDPGLRDDDQDFHQTAEEAKECTIKNLKEKVVKAIAKR